MICGGERPADIPVVEIRRSDLNAEGSLPAAILLKLTGLCESTSEARRAIQQGGAKLSEDKARIETHDQPIPVTDGLLLWVGKKRFCRIKIVEN